MDTIRGCLASGIVHHPRSSKPFARAGEIFLKAINARVGIWDRWVVL